MSEPRVVNRASRSDIAACWNCLPALLLFLGLLAAATVVRADYEAGARAFESGDMAGAIREWLRDARGGGAKSIYQLGALYEQGGVVPSDANTAFRLYRVATLRGYGPAEQAANRVAGTLNGQELTDGVRAAAALVMSTTATPVTSAAFPSRKARQSVVSRIQPSPQPANKIMGQVRW